MASGLSHCRLFGQAAKHYTCRLYDVACGCRIEGAAGEVADWLRGPDLERAIAPYCKADLLRGLNRDVLLKEDASVESRCSEAFAAVKRFEESHKVAAQVSASLGPPLSTPHLPPPFVPVYSFLPLVCHPPSIQS